MAEFVLSYTLFNVCLDVLCILNFLHSDVYAKPLNKVA